MSPRIWPDATALGEVPGGGDGERPRASGIREEAELALEARIGTERVAAGQRMRSGALGVRQVKSVTLGRKMRALGAAALWATQGVVIQFVTRNRGQIDALALEASGTLGPLRGVASASGEAARAS